MNIYLIKQNQNKETINISTMKTQKIPNKSQYQSVIFKANLSELYSNTQKVICE